MNQAARQLGFALLTIAMIGVGAAGVHVASHSSGDLPTCELCSAQGNPAFAIPVAALPAAAVTLQRHGASPNATPIVSLGRPAWRQRDPPQPA